MKPLTLIVPYYRNVGMLRRQLVEWEQYPDRLQIILVDDGSPEAAAPVVDSMASSALRARLRVYRVDVDIPWNRGGARNLGALKAETPWLLHVDIDHLLPAPCAEALFNAAVASNRWYRFTRWRRGAADETRKKDALPTDAVYGEIKPHIDSYLLPRTLYWQVGGYDEDYSGCLGGGSPFLKQLEAAAPVEILPRDVYLEVFTRSEVADASDFALSRDTSEYTRRRQAKEARGATKSVNPIRFKWSRVL